MTRDNRTLESDGRFNRCLTEFSIPVLLAGAVVVSALLWLAIYAVL